MAIRNLMEDVVSSVVGELLAKQKEELPHADMYWDDIIAYVLNRIPPKYITSERGILHDRIDALSAVQQRSDILFLAHEAIGFIKGRRTSNNHADYDAIARKSLFFPHVLGEVVEETTFTSIPDVEVTLMRKGKKAAMIDESWKNPYVTHRATKGFYHFWPDFDEEGMPREGTVGFTLIFSHPKFTKIEVDFEVPVVETFTLNKSHVVPITLMKTLDGVDISFLYE